MSQTTSQVQDHLLESFKNGNEKSFAHFFDLYYKSLCYFASPITQDQAQAEDIVADCMYKLWLQRSSFKTAKSIKAFLYISCRNACLNHLRQLKRRDANQELYLSQLEQSEDTILYQIIETEVLALLAKEIDELPDKCKTVFKLIYIENKKTDEIAQLLGISEKTVRGHKARAIESLKNQLLKKGISSLLFLAFLFLIDTY